jgi:uncharacterized protein
MSRIYWDTMLFVYWLEDHPQYSSNVLHIYEKMQERGDALCTSAFTLGELLVGPKQKRSLDAAQTIRRFLHSDAVELLPFTTETAERFADIRAAQDVSAADAIHLASAAHRGIDLFLTNERRLQGLVIPGIQFVTRMDVNLF